MFRIGKQGPLLGLELAVGLADPLADSVGLADPLADAVGYVLGVALADGVAEPDGSGSSVQSPNSALIGSHSSPPGLADDVAATGATWVSDDRDPLVQLITAQRVAVARALVSRPRIVFADEPTGNLDSRSGAEVLELLRRSADDHGQTIVMVTHDPVAAAWTDRVVFLADGRLVDEIQDPSREQVLEIMTRMSAPPEEL